MNNEGGAEEMEDRASVDTRIQDRQHFLENGGGGFPETLRLARPEVDRPHLFHHDESGQVFVGRDGHMERMVAARITSLQLFGDEAHAARVSPWEPA